MKCKHVSCTRTNPVVSTVYSVMNNQIAAISSYKYLGVHIHYQLNWDTHINSVISSANHSLRYLKHHLRLAPPEIKKTAYLSIIRPNLEYASSIWDLYLAHHIHDIEAFQNRATRFIFSDYSRHSSVTHLK